MPESVTCTAECTKCEEIKPICCDGGYTCRMNDEPPIQDCTKHDSPYCLDCCPGKDVYHTPE